MSRSGTGGVPYGTDIQPRTHKKRCKFSGLSPWPFSTPFSPTKVSSGPDSEPHMSNTMDLTYVKALESFRNGRSPVWDRYSASHTRKGCKFSGLSPWPLSTPISPTKVSSGPDSEPHMSNTMDLTYVKALESFRNGRSPVWDRYSASHTQKKVANFQDFLPGLFRLLFRQQRSRVDQTPSPTFQIR